MKNTFTLSLIIIILFTLLFISCASPESIQTCVNPDEQKSFLYGLIHGFLAPLSFIVSLFNDDVVMYAVNNDGGWYDFGFLLGIGGFSGGIFKSSSRRKSG